MSNNAPTIATHIPHIIDTKTLPNESNEVIDGRPDLPTEPMIQTARCQRRRPGSRREP